MAGFKCPYCSQVMTSSYGVRANHKVCFEGTNLNTDPERSSSCLQIVFYKCPNCEEYTIFLDGKGPKVNNVRMLVRPKSLARQYPPYIPQPIRNDYEEACAIVNLSPKASAALARRCLQGMIHDFWGITQKTLTKK